MLESRQLKYPPTTFAAVNGLEMSVVVPHSDNHAGNINALHPRPKSWPSSTQTITKEI